MKGRLGRFFTSGSKRSIPFFLVLSKIPPQGDSPISDLRCTAVRPLEFPLSPTLHLFRPRFCHAVEVRRRVSRNSICTFFLPPSHPPTPPRHVLSSLLLLLVILPHRSPRRKKAVPIMLVTHEIPRTQFSVSRVDPAGYPFFPFPGRSRRTSIAFVAPRQIIQLADFSLDSSPFPAPSLK